MIRPLKTNAGYVATYSASVRSVDPLVRHDIPFPSFEGIADYEAFRYMREIMKDYIKDMWGMDPGIELFSEVTTRYWCDRCDHYLGFKVDPLVENVTSMCESKARLDSKVVIKMDVMYCWHCKSSVAFNSPSIINRSC